MIYSQNPTNEEYLEEQLYSKNLELNSAETKLQVYMAVYHEKVNGLKASIDSLERQINRKK